MSNHFAVELRYKSEWLKEFGFINCVYDVNLPQ